jgi:hypothetical protein
VGPARQRKKKKKKETVARAVAGEGDSGLLGLLGRKVSEVGFLFFFFFFFQLFSNQLFKLQIQIKFLLNLSQNFIIFLKVTQATKNHAKPNNDAQPLVVSILIKLSLIF